MRFRTPGGGDGQLTVNLGVPFRLLVTCACPARNVLFKTRLSSNAGYYSDEKKNVFSSLTGCKRCKPARQSRSQNGSEGKTNEGLIEGRANQFQ